MSKKWYHEYFPDILDLTASSQRAYKEVRGRDEEVAGRGGGTLASVAGEA